jgi:hypothetical protein
MKKSHISFLLALITAGFLLVHQSCDIIEEPFVELTNSDTITSGGGDTTHKDVRKVLLEDVTGHKCINCPDAADIARSLKAQYGEQVIIMAIHAGFFATPNASGEFTYDFRTAVGGEIHNYYGFITYPSGMVNRSTPESAPSPVLNSSEWGDAVAEQLALPQQASIHIDNIYDPGNRNLQTHIEINFLETLDGEFYFAAYLIESEIVQPQASTAGILEDYEHNHVLRASMNGTWGQPVGGDGNAVSRELSTHDLSITLDEEWVAEHCELIVIVHQFDSPTRSIIQAEEAGVTE